MSHPKDLTVLLGDWRNGNDQAGEQILDALYDELRRLAGVHMRGERANHTLQPTELVHEAYARLIPLELDFESRAHFVSMAARTMRRVLVDHARARAAGKRQEHMKVSLQDKDVLAVESPTPDSLVSVNEVHLALEQLQALDERQAQILELHYFGGLRYDEIAEVLQVSEATVGRDLRHGKAWMGMRLRETDANGP